MPPKILVLYTLMVPGALALGFVPVYLGIHDLPGILLGGFLGGTWGLFVSAVVTW